jgi:hypothetical protein
MLQQRPQHASALVKWMFSLELVVASPAAAIAGCPDCAVHCACWHTVRAVRQLPATVEVILVMV